MEWVNISEQDFGSGINANASEDRIPEGYAEDLVNIQLTSEGYIKKRDGYTSYVSVPVAIRNVSWVSGQTFSVTVDESVDLTDHPIVPLCIRLSNPLVDNTSPYTEFSDIHVFSWTIVNATTFRFILSETSSVNVRPSSVTTLGSVSGLHVNSKVEGIHEYTSTGENYIVANSRGMLYKVEDETINITAPNKVTTANPQAQVLGPAFYDNDEVPLRTRGYIQGNGVSIAGMARILTVSYLGNNIVRYTLSFPSGIVSGNPIKAHIDTLDVIDCGWSVNNGEFEIEAFDYSNISNGSITVDVINPARFNDDLDETECGGRAGVLTDVVRVNTGNLLDLNILAGSTSTVDDSITFFWTGRFDEWDTAKYGPQAKFNQEVTLAPNAILDIESTSDVLMLPVHTLTCGDHIFGRRILNTVYFTTAIVDLTGNTLTTAAFIQYFRVGHKLRLTLTNNIIDVTIASIESVNQFILTEDTGISGGTGVIRGQVHLSGEVDIVGDTAITSVTRCFPLPRQITNKIFGYSSTDFSYVTGPAKPITSLLPIGESNVSILNDALYITSGEGLITKYDGSIVHDAGIQRLQPGVTIWADYTQKRLTGLDRRYFHESADNTDATPLDLTLISPPINYGLNQLIVYNQYTVGANTTYLVQPGDLSIGHKVDIVKLDSSGQLIRIPNVTITNSETATVVYTTYTIIYTRLTFNATVAPRSPGESTWIERTESDNIYKYYLRWEYTDINGVVQSSTPTQLDDLSINPKDACSIYIRATIPPGIQTYNWENLILKVFRTRRNGKVFHEVGQIAANSTTQNDAYIDFIDTVPDALLPSDDLTSDLIMTGTEKAPNIGVSWEGMPTDVQFLATLNNRLILGNYKSPHELTLRFQSNTLTSNIPPQSTRALGGIILDSITPDVNNVAFLFTGDNTLSTNAQGATYGTSPLFSMLITNIAASPVLGMRVSTAASLANVNVGDWVQLVRPAYPTSSSFKLITEYNKSINPIHAGWYRVYAIGAGYLDVYNKSSFNTYPAYNSAIHCTRMIHLPSSAIPPYFSNAIYTIPVYIGPDLCFQALDGNVSLASNSTIDPSAPVLFTGGLDNYISDLNSIMAKRLALAINAVSAHLRRGGSTYGRYPAFWAEAGDYVTGYAQMRIRSLNSFSTQVGYGETALSATVKIFANDTQVTAAGSTAQIVNSIRYLFPSRIACSYKGYAEIFDALYTDGIGGDSTIDIDVAEGGEITGMVSLFGDSVFAGSQKDGILIVAKRNAMYAVDIEGKEVRKLESFGSGCSYPGAITTTTNGVIYLHESGIWRVNTNMTCTKLSESISRKYVELIKDSQDNPVLIQDALNQSIKIAMQDTENNILCNYQARESQGKPPGWTRHILEKTPTCFGKLGNVIFYGDSSGLIHRENKNTWNDNGTPVVATFISRATDFGDANRRKVMSSFRIRFRNSLTGTAAFQEGTTCYVATELNLDYRNTDNFKLASQIARDNLSDKYKSRVETVGFSVPKSRAVYFQIKIENNKDEPLDITAIDYRVAGLDSGRGMKDARQTE